MKKILLLTTALMLSATSFAQVQITNVGVAGENNSFVLPAGNHVYAVLMGNETRKAISIDDAHYTYIGPDEKAGRPFYNWDGNSKIEDTSTEKNSFGVLGESTKFVSYSSWSGWGENVKKTNPIDLSGITTDYKLHLSVKSTARTSGTVFDIYFVDGDKHDGHIQLGTKSGCVGNISADGNWYNIDLSMEYLADQYGFDLSSSTSYADKNLFCLSWGATGNNLYIDTAFFYGPQPTTSGIVNVETGNQKADASLYNLAGQRVEKGTKGLLIQNGKKYLAN